MQDVRKKLKIKRLSKLKDSVLESIKKDALCTDHWWVDSTAEILHNDDLVGYVKYSLTKETIYGMKSNDYDVPDDPDELELTLNEAHIEIYGQTGEVLKNISDKLNDLLYKDFGKKLNA